MLPHTCPAETLLPPPPSTVHPGQVDSVDLLCRTRYSGALPRSQPRWLCCPQPLKLGQIPSHRLETGKSSTGSGQGSREFGAPSKGLWHPRLLQPSRAGSAGVRAGSRDVVEGTAEPQGGEAQHSRGAGSPGEPQPRAVPTASTGTAGAGTKGTGCAKMQSIRSPFPFHSDGTFAPIVSCYPGCCYEISLSA